MCRIIACIQHNVKLTTMYFDHQAAACVGHDAWRSEGLPVPPSKVVAQGWEAVPRFLRVRRVFAQFKAVARAADALSPPCAQFHDSMTSALNARSALHDKWRRVGLPVPPGEVVAEGRKKALRLLRVRRVCALYLNLSRAQLTPSPRPARSSTTA